MTNTTPEPVNGSLPSDSPRKKSTYPTAYIRESDGEEMVALGPDMTVARSFLEATAGGQRK